MMRVGLRSQDFFNRGAKPAFLRRDFAVKVWFSMKLKHGRHLAYCTNIHRGETWPETFTSLQHSTLAVRERVGPNRPYAMACP